VRKTSLYIEPEVEEALERRAQAEGVPKAEIIRQALREAAREAPRPRFRNRGVVEYRRNVSEHVDEYLERWGFGES
jgi:hypothetical protein